MRVNRKKRPKSVRPPKGRLSWGRAHRYYHAQQRLRTGETAFHGLIATPKQQSIAHGMGRSYGDTALTDGGKLLLTQHLDSIISADWDTGVIRAQAGLTIDALLKISVPRGWFPSVTPGSKFVTLGGCVANDVHGKNHHKLGSFGTCVRAFALERSDRDKLIICSPSRNKAIFSATLSGLGLTGVLRWVEIQLIRITSAYLDVENIVYKNLEEFLTLSDESEKWDYTVAWIDCFAKRDARGRGIFSRARFAGEGRLNSHDDPKVNIPITGPRFLLNKTSIRMFNWAYRHRPGSRYKGKIHYGSFFYPLDGIANWNRLYGRKGFYQHQCLIPPETAKSGILALLTEIEKSGQGSFLAVLKRHGVESSPALLPFCGPGLSLALDFSNQGKRTTKLLQKLDAIVLEHGGRFYPAKNGQMSADTYKLAYPNWQELEQYRDPALLSAFWSRIVKSCPANEQAECNTSDSSKD